IEKYGDSRFEDAEFPDGKIQNRAGWRRGKGEDQLWLVLPEVFKTEDCAGLDPTMVAKVLADRGRLLRAEERDQRCHRVQGRVLKLYTITPAIFSGSDTETPGTPGTPGTGPEIKGFLHSDLESVTVEKSNKNGPVPTVPTVPTDLSNETVCTESEPNPEGWQFNTEDDSLEIPECLRRGGCWQTPTHPQR